MSAPLTPAARRALWRIPAILAEDGFAADLDLAAELGLEYGELRTALGILYRRRQVDRCGEYIALPADPGPLTIPERAA